MKSKQKTKRIYVWCNETYKHISCYDGKRKRNKVKQSRVGSKVQKLPSKVRCPNCGKQFKPRIKECEDLDCWHIYIPAHKKWVKENNTQ